MKKTTIILLSIFSSSACFADWSGDILCVQPRPIKAGHALVADATGRITVTAAKTGEFVATLTMDDVRFFSKYGQARGKVERFLEFTGNVLDGNDQWLSAVKTTVSGSIIDTIEFDLSSMNRGSSKITTKLRNVYEMDCTVRED